MKHIFITLFIFLSISFSTCAEVFKTPSSKSAKTDSTTIHVYEIKGQSYPIYKSTRGKYYIWRTSKKTGKQYKQYLPKNIQEQINKQ